MSSLGAGIYDSGMTEGFKRGFKRGLKRGLRRGDLKRAKKIAHNLNADGLSTDRIAKVLETDTATVQKWLSSPQEVPAE